MTVYDALKGIWPLKKRVHGVFNLAKVYTAAEAILLVCEPGGACGVTPWHGSVHNAPHHVCGVVNLYASAVWECEPSVAFC